MANLGQSASSSPSGTAAKDGIFALLASFDASAVDDSNSLGGSLGKGVREAVRTKETSKEELQSARATKPNESQTGEELDFGDAFNARLRQGKWP